MIRIFPQTPRLPVQNVYRHSRSHWKYVFRFLTSSIDPELIPPKVVSELNKQDDSSTGGGGTSLTISSAADVLTDAHLGDSISINGIVIPRRRLPFHQAYQTSNKRYMPYHNGILQGCFQGRSVTRDSAKDKSWIFGPQVSCKS